MKLPVQETQNLSHLAAYSGDVVGPRQIFLDEHTEVYLKVSTSSNTELPSDRVCPFCTGDFFLDRIMYLHFGGFNCRRCSSDQPFTVLMSDCTVRKSSGCDIGR